MAPHPSKVPMKLQPHLLLPSRWSSQKKNKQHKIETQKKV